MSADMISFPGLGLSLDPPRIAFSVFGRPIFWYGIILAVAFLVAALYAIRRAPKFGITGDDLTDVLIFATPAAIIGARAYYVLFEFDQYADNPISALYVWDGGVAIYGAVIAAVLTVLIVTTVKKISAPAVLDIGALGLLIGQAIGRWGNFINREAYGTVTDLPWRMEIYDRIAGVRQAVHPTFLYESLWNALGFVLLHSLSKKRKYNGETFIMYLAWYGLGRGLIEGMRTDSLYMLGANLRVSQVLGFTSFVVAGAVLFYNFAFKHHDPARLVDLTAAVPETQTETPAAEDTGAPEASLSADTDAAQTSDNADSAPVASSEAPDTAAPAEEAGSMPAKEDEPDVGDDH